MTDEELLKTYWDAWQAAPVRGDNKAVHAHALRTVLAAWGNRLELPDSSARPSIDTLMQQMPHQWRKRWCTAQICGCMGCANQSGGLARHGYTQADHSDWLARQGSSGGDFDG